METIVGIYEKTLYRNVKNGYTIFKITSKSLPEYRTGNGLLLCKGIIPVYTSGMPISVDCTVEKDASDNYYLSVSGIREYCDDYNLTIRYLSSDSFQGIGEKTAKKIIEVTGPDIFSFINSYDAENKLLNSSLGMSKENIKKFIKVIKNTYNQRLVFEFLNKYGGTYENAAALYNFCGHNAIELFKKNPYEIGDECHIGFHVCDAIGAQEGVLPFDQNRLKFLVFDAMKTITRSGNMYSTPMELAKVIDFLSLNSAMPCHIPFPLIICEADSHPAILVDRTSGKTRIYFKKMWKIENDIATELFRLENNKNNFCFDDKIINEISETLNIEYSESQNKCFQFLKTGGVKIISGSAGTGKTTIQKGLINAFLKLNPKANVLLAAPTGRASHRMTKSTGFPSKTIHKLLNINFANKHNGDGVKNEFNKLDADMIIVDEASMIDSELFLMLLKAIKSGGLLILCGDPNQLPSVGAGNVLKDLISTNLFECVKLEVVYRQLGKSSILFNANSVQKGTYNFKIDDNFKIVVVKNQSEIKKNLIETYKSLYNSNDLFAVQALSLVKKGDAGSNVINKEIQKITNKEPDMIGFGNSTFRVGDKIMTTANNYDVGYLNGEIGVVKSVEPKSITVVMDDEEITITPSNYKDVSLAYCATVHKAQGSEFDTVIIALPVQSFNMLNRNILYTAITRAKKNVIIIAEDGAVLRGIRYVQNNFRHTSLNERTVKYFKRFNPGVI